MRSLWSDSEADSFVARYGDKGVSRDLALRVYTTRLLGGDPRLVLHGGGNSSVKTTMRDLLGDEVEVLCVKGSGWDMGNIERQGLPAVRLAPLRKLRQLERLADEDMVNLQRGNLLDSAAPNPSVETLLHAFLPAKFVDHTHATAVLALTDQPEGEARSRECYDGLMALVAYIMPGVTLAKKAAEVHDRDPCVEGLILLKHGIFTLGATAREAYERMIAMVRLAEERLQRGRRNVFASAALPSTLAPVSEVAPMLRGLCAIANDRASGIAKRQILDFRGATPEVMNYINGAELARYSQIGVVTPDHTIRTKNWPLILPPPEAGRLREWRDGPAAAAVAAFERRYLDYFRRHNAAQTPPKTALDPLPRIVLVPGVGLFGLGGGSGIGAATAAAMARAGAEVAVLDRELDAAKAVARAIGGTACAIACDVTEAAQVRAAFDLVCNTFGGVDIVVSNAGAAWQGSVGEVDDAILRRSFELNFFAHQSVAQHAVKIMRAQGTGGCLLFNTSKQAVNPGRDFGPYGLPKAATLALMKPYALDHGRDGIRANAVNAHRIRSGLLTADMIQARARARGVSEIDYMSGNLLGREVAAEDVADAFVYLAQARKTTAATLTVDGGNIEASLR